MSLVGAGHQKSVQTELPFEVRGEALGGERSGEASTATSGDGRSGTDHLMEEVVERGNLERALKRVKANKGSPGVDGMTVEELPAYLKANWEGLRAQLLEGRYQPQQVRQREIPKRGGGVRRLGIPTVVDRFLQQAILQVLNPRFDPTFSDHSYGFRPGRRAHDAVRAAQRYIQDGRQWVVDLDLEQFFDRVNHDVLMGRLTKRIADRRLLGLIRRFLEAGVLANGLSMERHEGTPQGGPLSPLLANVLLDEVDKELEKRGHAFVRYADDCNVYVRSRRSGERVMQTLRRLYAKLRLRVNEAKSAVARPWDRKLLGYSFWVAKDGAIKRRIADQALEAMKERVRQITGRSRGRSLSSVIAELRSYLVGWKEYFRLTEMQSVFRDIDQWIRRRVRLVQLKQWKRGPRIFRELCARGVPRNAAASAAAHGCRWWRTARHPGLNLALPNRELLRLGVPRLAT
ncbi:MAG: group II intron reverse transcriptase/maturase [Bacillota bacterium]|nr:group II intron reverse transcriptase/maturase [Bacillota bacterium]